MRTERNAILRTKPPELPGEYVELKGVYLLLQDIQDQLKQLSYDMHMLRTDLMPDKDEDEE